MKQARRFSARRIAHLFSDQPDWLCLGALLDREAAALGLNLLTRVAVTVDEQLDDIHRALGQGIDGLLLQLISASAPGVNAVLEQITATGIRVSLLDPTELPSAAQFEYLQFDRSAALSELLKRVPRPQGQAIEVACVGFAAIGSFAQASLVRYALEPVSNAAMQAQGRRLCKRLLTERAGSPCWALP